MGVTDRAGAVMKAGTATNAFADGDRIAMRAAAAIAGMDADAGRIIACAWGPSGSATFELDQPAFSGYPLNAASDAPRTCRQDRQLPSGSAATPYIVTVFSPR
jgi:hypothetical protein